MSKNVYSFGGGTADGDGKMKDVLGGKGAGLAEMSRAGLPVPAGFTIATQVCNAYFRSGKQIPPDVQTEIGRALAKLEKQMGQKLGDASNPLLLSVRSGAKFSMPGMMNTILNLGLNDTTTAGLAAKSGNERFAYDCYRRFIQMFGEVALEIEMEKFDHIFDSRKAKIKVKLDTDLKADDLKAIIADYKKLVERETKKPFPEDPREQLNLAVGAVFGSWWNPKANYYRRMEKIPDEIGTAANVQAMVFGNMGDDSGTGVGFTRDPGSGEKVFYGEFLMNAQGEDVVSGIRTPVHISKLEEIMPKVYQQLREITTRLEKHYRDMQDFEFTIQDGRLYMLQTRNGKRTGRAAVRVAIQMVEEGLITKEEAIFRVEPNQLYDFLVPSLDEKGKDIEVLATGLPASPGAAVGQIVFTAEEAVEKFHKDKSARLILVRAETTPEDIAGMEVAAGILTARGGMTSHAAVVTRGMGKCCVAGAGDIEVDEKTRVMRAKGKTLKEGDWISLDGTTGRVINGQLNTVPARPDDPELQKLMGWAEPYRRMGVRANADIPRDALQARAFGAEGIGLCRTEHMFFAADRIPHMRAMILASNEKDRRTALRKLLPMQRNDFIGLFRAMDGLAVTIRTLDPPLHEFLPKREELLVEITRLEDTKPKSPKLKELRTLLNRVEQLHEQNPMLGLRGCRLGITYPEMTEMQARGIFEAAVKCAKEGVKVKPEIMIPLTTGLKEMANQAALVRKVADEVFAEKEAKVEYLVGTMIELPRACLVADEIAKEAEFFSFGTNDLTQTTFGFSRDDVGKILTAYLAEGILKQDPFAVLDREGVGELMRIGTDKGRAARPDIKIGICGEHGGDPSSVEFCAELGFTYVSCSPFRVLTARLAAAQAGASAELKIEAGRTK